MEKISIIGSGTMGNGIAHCFAQQGFEVYLIDTSKESLNNAKIKISKNLDRMIKKEKISYEEKEIILIRQKIILTYFNIKFRADKLTNFPQ